VGPRVGLDRCGKSRLPSGFDPRTVQPVASRYIDYATRPTCRYMVDVKRGSHATSRWTYRVLLGVLFKGRLNGCDYTASIADEMHVSTRRCWNDTVMEKQNVLGHTLSQ